MSAPDAETVQKMHRWFAVECNNRGWELVEQPERSAEEDREMMTAAQAAAYHWGQVGTPLHEARANLLLADAHAHTGHGAEALALAEACCSYFAGEDGTEWDRAFATLELAHAHAAAGNASEAAEHLAKAASAGEALPDEEERTSFAASLKRIKARCGPA